MYKLPTLGPMNAVTLQRCNSTHALLLVGVGCANADSLSWPSRAEQGPTNFLEAIGAAVRSRESLQSLQLSDLPEPSSILGSGQSCNYTNASNTYGTLRYETLAVLCFAPHYPANHQQEHT